MILSRANVALMGVAVLLAAVLTSDLIRHRPSEDASFHEWPALDPDVIDGLRLANADGEVEGERVNFRWQFTGGDPMDGDLVDKVLYTFDEPLRADVRVADEVDDPALYGLDDAHRIDLELLTEGEVVLAIEIGRSLAGGVSFVRPPGDPGVFRARVPGRFRLEKAPVQWRDLHVLSLPEGRVDHLTVTRGGDVWHYQRLTESWICEEQPEMMLDARLVEAMARGLGGLRATRIVDEVPEDAFADPPLRVEVVAQEHAPALLEFGRAVEDGGRYVRQGDRTFVIAPARFETFDKDPRDLRDRMIAKVDWRETERVTVRKGPWRFVVIPIGDKVWAVEEPRGYSIDLRELGYSVNALLHLRGFALVDDVTEAQAGVDDPEAMIITIDRVESAPITLRISPLQGDLHYVRRDGRDQTYVVREASARLLVKGFGLQW